MKNLFLKFQQHIDNGLYPGVEWKINYKDNIYQGKVGYLDLSAKKPIQTNSIYRIWSMTKPIISIVILQLIDEKRIQLDDHLNLYLPIFDNLQVVSFNNQTNPLDKDFNIMPTIKDLLLHTAGFSYNFFDDEVAKEYSKKKLFFSSDTTLEEEINILASCPLLYQPNRKWHYSVSIDVLGRIIEIVTKDKLQNVLKNRIFEPLEMVDTSFCIKEDKHQRLMTSYEYISEEKKLIKPRNQNIALYGYPLNNPKYARGGHGLYSSINDYSKFAEMLLSGKTKDGKTILSDNMLRLASSNHLDDVFFPLEINIPGSQDEENDLEPYGWGLGFRVLVNTEKSNKIKSIGEFGWAGAAATFFLVDPKNNLSAVLMTQVLNADKVLRDDFIEEIYNNL
tara:strand:- start:69 stop:1244 length:1176 start_codon:yes stop_codon:yes gene_type:complete